MKIILATQGAVGIVALRELFSLGYSRENITVILCNRSSSSIEEFLKFNQMPIISVSSSEEFDTLISNTFANLLISISWKYKFSDYAIKSIDGRLINFHPGLLPQYKGCYSTPWSIINNEKYVGFTYHFIDNDFDSGNILLIEKIKINKQDTAHSLHYKIFQRGLSNLGDVIGLKNTKGIKQFGQGNYYPNKLPYNGIIQRDWSESKTERFIRAMYFPPLKPAVCIHNGQEYFVENISEFKEVISV